VERSPYRRRIQVLVDVLNKMLERKDEVTRQDVVAMLKKAYEKRGISPLKGKASPPDLYDKEMVSLYIVGKYGLGIHEEYADVFSRVFYLEEAFDKAVEYIKAEKFEDARSLLKAISPANVIESNTVARMLRIPFTKLLLGFMSEEEFVDILHKTLKAVPEEERTVKNYAKFYIAFKLAEAIFKKEVRNRDYKEALKKALAIRLGFSRATPSDDYVALIAKEVFNIPDSVLEKVLSLKKQEKQELQNKAVEQEQGSREHSSSTQ